MYINIFYVQFYVKMYMLSTEYSTDFQKPVIQYPNLNKDRAACFIK